MGLFGIAYPGRGTVAFTSINPILQRGHLAGSLPVSSRTTSYPDSPSSLGKKIVLPIAERALTGKKNFLGAGIQCV